MTWGAVSVSPLDPVFWLLRVGIVDGTPVAEARRIALINTLASLALVVSGSGLAFPTARTEPVIAGVAVFMTAVSGAVLWLHHRRRYDAASLIFVVAGLITVVIPVTCMSPHAGHANFLLLLVLLPWLIVSSQGLALALSLTSAVAYVVIVYIFDLEYDIQRQSGYIGIFAIVNMAFLQIMIALIGYYSRSISVVVEVGLETERRQSEKLVFEMLPAPIARRVSDGDARIAERFGDASVLFCALDGFQEMVSRGDAKDVVRLVNDVFGAFDELCERLGVEKIKTSGGQYMAATGVPSPRSDHAEVLAEFALEMQRVVVRRCTSTGEQVRLRIGINSGLVRRICG